MATTAHPASDAYVAPMTPNERKVILASSLGTVFEWYDFYLYGSLAAIIGAKFFTQFPREHPQHLRPAGVRRGLPGAPVRRLGVRPRRRPGRPQIHLPVTISIMGLSTFVVGLLPTSDQIGLVAPVILIALRMLQGLALGGEYGGAATYVAEHAPHGRRGFYTSWIQTTATLGLFLSLLIIVFTQSRMSAAEFAAWGWRVPFLVSILLLGISVWIRLQLEESPVFAAR